MNGMKQGQLFHLETAAHLMAHCDEMENWPHEALKLYRLSQAFMPRNNAANWHIQRLTAEE